MPYEWIIPALTTDAPVSELHLWPYRSLPKRGFVIFIAITVGMISAPLIGVVGSPVLWVLLPFLFAAVAGIWWALQYSYSQGSTVEELRLWHDRITLTRHNPRGPVQEWEANPHWVEVNCREKDGPVPYYLTLRGAGREVELGAFLSEEERIALTKDVRQRLLDLRE